VAAENDMPLEALADRLAPGGRPAAFDEFSAYPPIADYAFPVRLRGHRAGGAERLGRVDVPAEDGRPEHLRRDAGTGNAGWFRFRPRTTVGRCPSDRRYLPGTLVLETSWDCGRGPGWWCGECLVHGGRGSTDHPDGSTHIQARPPTTTPSTCCCGPSAAWTARPSSPLDCVPAFDYGRQHVRWRHTERGYTQAVVEPEGLDLTLHPDPPISASAWKDPAPAGRTLLKEGDTRFCPRCPGGRRIPGELRRRVPAGLGLDRATNWQHWLSHGRFPDPPLARPTWPAARFTLKGPDLSRPPAAIAAAATTSLPETPGGGAQTGTTGTLGCATRTFRAVGACTPSASSGRPTTTSRSSANLVERDRGDLQIVYGIDGRRELDEARARPPERLPGRPGRCGSANGGVPAGAAWTSGA